jgi:YVTN family beta-propeller protein
VHASPDGRWLYVANQGSETDPDRCLCIVDAERLELAARVPVGLGAHGITVSPDGTVFVSNIVDGTVSAVDQASRTVVRTFKVGAGPNGITYRSASGASS